MKPLHIGDNALGKRIELTAEDRAAHMHVIGSSGSGKSKFLEWMIRGDITNRQGFCLIDPHGKLYKEVLEYCAHWVIDREIILLDLSNPSHIIGFNPFRKAASGDISVQVDRRIAATMHAWGVPNTDDTPTLERMLRLIYTMLVEQDLPFQHAQYLIDFGSHKIREGLIAGVSSPLIRREWQELQQLRAKDWRGETLSVKNRLFRLLTSQTLARFLSSSTEALDIPKIIEDGKILLVNLGSSDEFSGENARIFGALLVNEIFEVARRRTAEPGGSFKPYYLYIDEFQTFITLDVTKMLDEVRKFKLFTVLAHQRFGQLDADLAADAVLTNCRIKAVFGGLPFESAKMMAQELFIGELDPMKIKVALYQTKFWPKYGRDRVYTSSTSTGRSTGQGDNEALASSSGAASGQFFSAADWFSPPEITGASLSLSNAGSTVSGRHTSSTEFDGEVEGVADVPIMIPVPFQELSSVQYFSTEEQLTQLTAALKEQFTRHCFIKIHEQKTQPMLVPKVQSFFTPKENIQWYEQRLHDRSNAKPAAEVDAAIQKEDSAFTAAFENTPEQGKGPSKSKRPRAAWEDLLGRE